jgi:hypothetical protein
MTHFIERFSPDELIPERPFTHPARIHYHVTTLRFMVDQLHSFLEQRPRHTELPFILYRPDQAHYQVRLIVAQPEQLIQAEALIFVGFLGHRRADADLSLAAEFDGILVAEIPDHPGLLSYSTMALICGNFSNLVIFADEASKGQWSHSQAHAQAVQKLAPHFYDTVCLYNGILPHGLAASDTLHLTQIKYYDYQQTPWWQGVREMRTEC